VDRGLSNLQREFRERPDLFYTEHDLASRAYHLIQDELGYPQIRDQDGEMHYIVHHEYPTPFRCDMHGTSFAVVDEEARAPGGGKYRRGHYDLVVLNPEFVEQGWLEVLSGQKYDLVKGQLPGLMDNLGEPPIYAGVEFIYRRTPFRSRTGVEHWFKRIRQDMEKLEASVVWRDRPFMQSIISIAFNRFPERDFEQAIQELVSGLENVVYCTPGA
jgi:hypothetical protein